MVTERDVWSDKGGQLNIPKSTFKLPSKDWKWLEEWQVYIDDDTDTEGWSYASDFSAIRYSNKCGSMDLVRRRKWTRICYTNTK